MQILDEFASGNPTEPKTSVSYLPGYQKPTPDTPSETIAISTVRV